jgi:hypothetical protein
MIEMTYELQYKYKDYTTAINIDAQLEKINSHFSVTREQNWLEIILILHAARVESGNGKVLDLELLLNQVGRIFKPCEEGLEEDVTLQAALSAQVRKMYNGNHHLEFHSTSCQMNRNKDTSANRKQKNKFAGNAKKRNRKDTVAPTFPCGS